MPDGADDLVRPWDLGAVTITLADAFFDDPVSSWIFDDVASRPAQLMHWWRWRLEHLPRHGLILTTPDDRSAAQWFRPDPVDDDAMAGFPAMLASLVGEAEAQRKLRGLSVIAQAHPHHERHWYLATLGTRRVHQGQGSARRVVDPVLERADAEGVGVYLESSNVRNVPFYERLGFVATGRIQIPDGPSLTPMWRSPVRRA
jgi:ribosomal protein S18 acetylase RimI-like enzyme